jgi:hypothetical protein
VCRAPFSRRQKLHSKNRGTSNALPLPLQAFSRIYLGLSHAEILGRTSKMSHDGIWRAACLHRNGIPVLQFEVHSVARGVTDVGVGSGALFGVCGSSNTTEPTRAKLPPTLSESNALQSFGLEAAPFPSSRQQRMKTEDVRRATLLPWI